MSETEVVQSLEKFKTLFEQLKIKLANYKEANQRLSDEKHGHFGHFSFLH